jgi:hypothetical protein
MILTQDDFLIRDNWFAKKCDYIQEFSLNTKDNWINMYDEGDFEGNKIEEDRMKGKLFDAFDEHNTVYLTHQYHPKYKTIQEWWDYFESNKFLKNEGNHLFYTSVIDGLFGIMEIKFKDVL